MEGIAVIGLAGRFPKASNVSKYWNNLIEGKDCFTEFSVGQLIEDGVPREIAERTEYVRRCYVIEDPAGFDAGLFGYSSKEAELIDPQQRILLECAWTAFENAGYDPRRYTGRIGIWAGSGLNNYYSRNILSQFGSFESVADFQTIIGNDKDYLASRIAYKLNLRGPAITVQTACSTSLVSVHMACQSLMTYECDMALAGGVSLQTPRMRGYLYKAGEIFSPDGFCRTFDKDANGTVLGEGCGLVVLCRLGDAVANGDNILAIIRGSAVNNDGAVRAGFTAPGLSGQVELIRMAMAIADVHADEIGYVETHGTGTVLGDPVEVVALTQVFRQTTCEKGYCGLGSVKTNIGHLDVAAGIAGLIKTICALRNRRLPPTLYFKEANPELNLIDSPFFVVDRLMDWAPRQGRRIAGVSSFGMGGTNAHVILEEYPSRSISKLSSRHWHLLPLSTATPSASKTAGIDLAGFLGEQPALNIADLAWTLAMGRIPLRYRRCVLAETTAEAAVRLVDPEILFEAAGDSKRSERPIIFLFSGQGTQYPEMGFGLYKDEPVFRESMDFCARILGPIGGCSSLLEILYGGNAEIKDLVHRTEISQPALVAFEYSLARLWESYGVTPSAVIGHSIGEYTAACLAGIFSVEDTLRLVRSRGQLMQLMPLGAMIAVPRPEAEVRASLPANLDLAVINSPQITIVSGDSRDVEAYANLLKDRGISVRPLPTSHAFHSRWMEPAARSFGQLARLITLREPRLPIASNLTGDWMTAQQATDPTYWMEHLRNSVRFGDNLSSAARRFDSGIMLEVGPGNTICSFIRQHTEAVAALPTIPSARHPRQSSSDQAFFLRAFGALWCHGAPVDLGTVYSRETRSRVALPSYPFERKRFWIDPRASDREPSTMKGFRFHNWKNAWAKRPNRGGKSRLERKQLNQENIAVLWREVLGASNIKSDDNFFDLGGHSLLAARLFARIKEEFGVNASLSLLFDFPTVRRLTEQLVNVNSPDWKSLVAIAREGSRVPIFLVHGAEGNILLYRELASALQPDQPIFGLQCKGLDGRGDHFNHLEDMAAEYVSEIMAIYPQGPLIIGGYCLGGMVAFEMAQQLTNVGREVALVMQIESYNFRGCGVKPKRVLRWIHAVQNIWFHAGNIFLAGKGEIRVFLYQKMRVEMARFKYYFLLIWGRGLRLLRRRAGVEYPHLRISSVNDAAYFAYNPKQYHGALVVFRPMRQFWGYDKKDCGWGVIAPGGLKIEILPVNPRGMITKPFVDELARRMRKSIDSALDKRKNIKKTI